MTGLGCPVTPLIPYTVGDSAVRARVKGLKSHTRMRGQRHGAGGRTHNFNVEGRAGEPKSYTNKSIFLVLAKVYVCDFTMLASLARRVVGNTWGAVSELTWGAGKQTCWGNACSQCGLR